MYVSIVASNAKKIIKKKGLLQYAVAREMKMNPKAFNAMLNNRKIITDLDVARLSRVLNVEPNELFRRDTT